MDVYDPYFLCGDKESGVFPRTRELQLRIRQTKVNNLPASEFSSPMQAILWLWVVTNGQLGWHTRKAYISEFCSP